MYACALLLAGRIFVRPAWATAWGTRVWDCIARKYNLTNHWKYFNITIGHRAAVFFYVA
jgi:hypothetical protein